MNETKFIVEFREFGITIEQKSYKDMYFVIIFVIMHFISGDIQNPSIKIYMFTKLI